MQKYIRVILFVTSILLLNTRIMSQDIDISKAYDSHYFIKLFDFYGIEHVFQSKNINYVTGLVQKISASSTAISDPNYDKRLLPYIKYSKNNRYYLDYASYSTVITNRDSILCSFDVDSEVSIGSVGKDSSRRIEFTGASEIVEGAGWISNDRVLVVKRDIDEKIIKLKIIDIQANNFIEYSVKLKKNVNKSFLYKELSKICKVE